MLLRWGIALFGNVNGTTEGRSAIVAVGSSPISASKLLLENPWHHFLRAPTLVAQTDLIYTILNI